MDNRSWTPRREEEAELEPSIAAMAAAKLENDGGRGTDSEEEDGSSPRRRRRRRSSTEVEVDEVSLYLSLRFHMRISRFFLCRLFADDRCCGDRSSSIESAACLPRGILSARASWSNSMSS